MVGPPGWTASPAGSESESKLETKSKQNHPALNVQYHVDHPNSKIVDHEDGQMMRLEEQELSNTEKEKAMESLIKDITSEMPKSLWDEQ